MSIATLVADMPATHFYPPLLLFLLLLLLFFFFFVIIFSSLLLLLLLFLLLFLFLQYFVRWPIEIVDLLTLRTAITREMGP